MASPESPLHRTNIDPAEIASSDLDGLDISVTHSPDGNGDLEARWDVDESGQLRIIKPLPSGEAVAVPFSVRQNNNKAT